MSDIHPPRHPIIGIAVAFEGGLLVVAWGLGKLVGVSFFAQTALTGSALMAGVVWTIPLLLGLLWSLRSTWDVVTRLRGVVEEKVAPLFAGCPLWGIATISLLAGVGEEALFRGVLQPYLAGEVGLAAGLAATSVLFGLAHWVTSTYAVMAGAIGLYLGALAAWQQNLLVPMVVHALYDFIALTYVVRHYRHRPAVSLEASAGDEPSA